ncbi:YhdP family protein [Oxalicibacterium sp.]|uniref:YhdP family protein n=1 Tax=Oxalicibacterium sp. TaxID=2766525 RepID=UPI002D7E7333|nr:YhdP family protein [Oxalicibacterium sp.]
MPTEQRQPDEMTAASKLQAGWRSFRQSCRSANTVTCRVLGWTLKLAVVAYFIFCAVFLTLRYAVLPQIADYRADVEKVATRAIGRPVTIGAISASWQGLRPYLALSNVAIYGTDGRPALQLPSVSATVSWWSFMTADLRLHRLDIDRPDMDVQRDANGNFFVAGLPVDLKQSSDGRAADWVLSQGEIRINDGQLRWKDNLRQAPELLLGHVDIVLHNSGNRHRFALKATPPTAIAAPLDVRAMFDHPLFSKKISDATRWTGEIYTDLRNTDLAAWKTYIDFPFDLQTAKGSVRAWLSFDHARVADLTADLALSDVWLQLRKDLAPLDLVRANGRISVREVLDAAGTGTPTFGMQGHAIAATDLTLQSRDGLILPKTTMSERYIAAKNGKPETTEVKVKLLDLQALAGFVGRLPLPAAQLRLLNDFSPRGQLKDFSAQWQGAYPAIQSYQVKGAFANLAMNAQPARAARPASSGIPAQAAVPAIPGFENLSGYIDANNQGGAFQLASDGLTLSLPAYFTDPEVVFNTLKMDAKWAFRPNDQLFLDVKKLDFEKDGLTASFNGTHLMPLNRKAGHALGTIDLAGSVNGLELNKVGSYLPTAMNQLTREWLAGGLVGGTLRDGRIRIKGDLSHFPFRTTKPNEKPKGEFFFGGRIEDGVLDYTPGQFGSDGKAPLWPLLDKINGTIQFDRTRMEIHADSGHTHGATVSDVKAVVPDLLSDNLMLEIDGNAAGPLQDLVQYTIDSPVAGWIGHFTDETKASGNATLALKLQLPLNHIIDAKVNGKLRFANNNVTLMNAMPQMTQTNGQLEFDEKGVTLDGIKTSFLGGVLALTGGSQKDGAILIKADGNMTSAGLRKSYAAPAMQKFADRVSGGTRYNATIGVKGKLVDVTVESNLRGLGLDFPAPLGKAAKDAMPLKFVQSGQTSDNAALARDTIQISLGTSIAASYQRERSTTDSGAAWRVARGGIGINTPAPQPDSGLMVSINLRSLNMDDWLAVTSAIAGNDDKSARKTPSGPGGAPDIAQYVEPNTLAVRANELYLLGKKIDDVVVGVSHDANIWQANINSKQAAGYLTWIESSSGRGLGKVTARLASLVVPKTAGSEVKDLLDDTDKTTEMPALDIVADDFQLFDRKLGRLELLAHYVRASEGREWKIRNLAITNPDAKLTASGTWLAKNTGNTTNLDYKLDIADAGNLLGRFGFVDVLRKGKGDLSGNINWKGLPFSIDYPTLSGDINLDISTGQFLKVEPGAAKLLGVLSLQSLPRRLTLDFRDVFSEGFAFDGINGNAQIANGVARTDNLKMRGVSATVLIDGSADIVKESQDLRAVIIPEINAGAASVAYALAVNPVIGAGTFLAQLFLRAPLMKAFTFEYKITGPWSDPNVVKVERRQDTTSPNSHPAPAVTEN